MEKNKYIALSDLFVLRCSEAQKVLYDLQRGKNYQIDADQYEFLLSLSGELRLTDILEQYDMASRSVICEFINTLSAIGALSFFSEPNIRLISKKVISDNRLESVHLEPSAECNMNCVHCYQSKYRELAAELKFEEIVSLLDQMNEMQVSNVGISGGEPFMLPYLFEMIRAVEKRDMRVSALFTNGLLIDDSIVEKIKAARSKFSIFVSLDSISPEGMSFRGYNGKEAVFVVEKILNNIDKLVANGLNVVLNTVVNAVNINDIDRMYAVVENLGIDSWRIGFPKPTSGFKRHRDKFDLEWGIIAERCLAILRHHFENQSPFHLQIEYLFREELFEGGPPDSLLDDDYVCDYEGRRSECCIKPNGDVVSCAYCSDLPIGNIKESSLWDIWYSPIMKKAKTIRIGDVLGCRDCNIRQVCGAGCRANAFFLHSDFWDAKDEYACKAVRFFEERVMPLLKRHNFL